VSKFVIYIALLLFIILTAPSLCKAQFPEGPPIPISGVESDEMHMASRFGYEANSSLYKYHGEVQQEGNFAALGGTSLYGLGNLALGCGIRGGNILQPDRLWGTFEFGIRRKYQEKRLAELFYQHQSAHSMDRDDWPEAMYEMFGVRLREELGRANVSSSIAYYNRRIYLDYDMDAQARISYHFAGSEGHKACIDFDLHGVSENSAFGAGFIDYSIEPSIQLTKRYGLYATYGLEHDIQKPNGETDQPIVFGVKAQM